MFINVNFSLVQLTALLSRSSAVVISTERLSILYLFIMLTYYTNHVVVRKDQLNAASQLHTRFARSWTKEEEAINYLHLTATEL